MALVYDSSTSFGYPPEKCEAAKNKLNRALWIAARQWTQLTYTDAVAEIREFLRFDPHDAVFHHMLCQISVEEDAAGRGLLSALVVHKYGNGQPGPGFYELASSLGRDTRDRIRFWIEEVNRLCEEANVVRVRN
jgi:hypothetical protein